ncbi:hypothetical protein PG996_008785 [Apiospora saccharicola]|uniref:Uncharacterized protein n=1 Tax=Apiospora saccharicola TaxID=335842 RepID=A0ABR1UYY6_9PEZI
MPALRQVVIHNHESGPGDKDWWCGWDSMMEMYYFRDDPVPFDVRILGPPDVNVSEINRHNHLKVGRDDRRRGVAEHTGGWDSDYEASGDDEEPDAPGLFRTGWQHIEGCMCTSRQQT